jgi:hypothetical protein
MAVFVELRTLVVSGDDDDVLAWHHAEFPMPVNWSRYARPSMSCWGGQIALTPNLSNSS